MLHPTPAIYESDKWKPNAHSCTLKVSAGGQSMLLAGDIEAPQEALLLSTMPERLALNVLLAPHHGSGTSSTPEFLDKVAPEIAVFQVGYRNRYQSQAAGGSALCGASHSAAAFRCGGCGQLAVWRGSGWRGGDANVSHGAPALLVWQVILHGAPALFLGWTNTAAARRR